MSKVFPDVMSGIDKNNLKCKACEYAKHTRTTYVSKVLKSISPFMLVHSDVWTVAADPVGQGLAAALP